MQRANTLNRVWDVSTLDWVRMQQPILEGGSITLSGAMNQGTPAATANRWPVQITDGTDLALVSATGALLVDGSAVTQPVSIATTVPTIGAGQASSSGNNTLITPTAGMKLRVYYLSYNPVTAAECAFRFGATGTLFLRNNIASKSVVAKEMGVSRYLEGAVNEPLILNLSDAVTTNWTVYYSEA